jgi:prolyl 4-hydroxylase
MRKIICFYLKVKPWYSEHVEAQNDVDKYVTNPLNAFLLIKRNVYDMKMIESRLTAFMEDVKAKLQNISKNSFLHKREVTGAVAGVIRAQRTYHLKNEDLIDGIVNGVKTRENLTVHDVYVMAIEARKTPREEYFAQGYLKLAAEKLEKGEDKFKEVNDTKIDQKLESFKSMYIKDPYDESYELPLSEIRDTLVERILTHKVCRGSLKRSASETKNLRCRYDAFSAFSTIAPFKIQEESHDPFVVFYHDAFSDAEMDELVELARPKQLKATVGLTNSFASDDDRLAQLAWLYDGDFPILDRINRRIEDMTGLSMKYAEALQVQNYGVGGHYYAVSRKLIFDLNNEISKILYF